MHEFAQTARSNKFIFYRYMSKQLENGWLTLNLTSWYDNRRKHAIWYDNRPGPCTQGLPVHAHRRRRIALLPLLRLGRSRGPNSA